MVFNLDQVGRSGRRADQLYNVTANDVPPTHLIMRSRDLNAPACAWAA
jgi:hypothetical protein